jgi:hypothetical protein
MIHERTTVLANTRYPLMPSPVLAGWGQLPGKLPRDLRSFPAWADDRDDFLTGEPPDGDGL